MTKNKFLTSETLKEEYHQSLDRAVERLHITDETRKILKNARKNDDSNYIALAALAHEYGEQAFYLGLKIYMDKK